MEHLLQIPVSLIFGYFIDACMILLGFVNPHSYPVKVIDLLIGCLILGVGVYMEVLADVVMLPGESFVRAVVFRWKTEFGITKICFDVSMAVIAAVLSFVLAGRTGWSQRRYGCCGTSGWIYRKNDRTLFEFYAGKVIWCCERDRGGFRCCGQ